MFFSSEKQSFKGCQLTLQPSFECADLAFLVIHHRCIFVFCCISDECSSLVFVMKCVAGLATKCMGSIGHENDGNAHPQFTIRQTVGGEKQ